MSSLAIPQCKLSEYQKLAARLARVSDAQIEDFVRYVSTAHSWYKHLPLFPPGYVFYFFLDPFAGYDCKLKSYGGAVCEERRDDCINQHHSLLPTEVYRSRFGCLSYEPINRLFVKDSTQVLNDHLPIFATRDRAYRIPNEIAITGSTAITAVVHPASSQHWLWIDLLGEEDPTEGTQGWPEETGGQTTLNRVLDLCKRAARKRDLDELDAELKPILAPESRRLHENMVESIRRMLALAYQEHSHGN